LELADLVGAQPFAEAERQRRREERARLLYVGTTRARDHLVLCRAAWDKGATDWLDELVDDSGAPVLALPWDEAGRQELTLGDRSWSCEVHQVLGTDLEPVGPPPHTPTWFTAPAGPVERSPQAVRPSELGAAPESPSIADRVHLGDRLALRCSSERMADVGNALHGFFVADPGPESPGRRAVAARLVDHHGLSGMLAPEVALEASDRLRRWLAAHAPGPRLAEWPVRQRLPGGRYLSGEIDLLVPLARGWLLLDHKSFPGTLATRDARLGKWAAQLAAYQEAVEAATARPVVQTWIHLPIRGELMRIESSQPEA
jgi:ATP-dependent exoDNAse (exonuclease V) beta subunit